MKKTPQQMFETQDSILAGILKPLGWHYTSSYSKELGRVVHKGPDVEPFLIRLQANEPIGSLDALQSCKAARSDIFSLKLGRR